MSDNDWKNGLTPEQVATVEKATQAWHESRPHSHLWFGIREDTRSAWCAQQLVALRAVGVIPPAKVKTRGEVAAAEYVQEGSSLDKPNEKYLVIARNGYGTRVYPGPNAQFNLWRTGLLAKLANIIDAERDAERAAAFEEAAKIAEEYRPGAHGLIVSDRISHAIRVRAAQPREHLRDDVAEPNPSAAPTPG